MKLQISLGALAALIVLPASAGAQDGKVSGSALSSQAASGKAAKKTAKKKVSRVSAQRMPTRGNLSYSSDPTHDVFVNGEYVGSDPDPRIRWTLRQEWIGRMNNRN